MTAMTDYIITHCVWCERRSPTTHLSCVRRAYQFLNWRPFQVYLSLAQDAAFGGLPEKARELAAKARLLATVGRGC